MRAVTQVMVQEQEQEQALVLALVPSQVHRFPPPRYLPQPAARAAEHVA